MASRRVLIVDSDEGVQDFLGMALTDEGYHVAGARNSAGALRHMATFMPDVIILDMGIHATDVQAFVQASRRLSIRRIPLICMSTSAGAEAYARFVDCDTFLAKPFDLDNLLMVVDKHISRVG